MRNGLPEIQYLTSAEDGEERGGVARKYGGILADNKKYKNTCTTAVMVSKPVVST